MDLNRREFYQLLAAAAIAPAIPGVVAAGTTTRLLDGYYVWVSEIREVGTQGGGTPFYSYSADVIWAVAQGRSEGIHKFYLDKTEFEVEHSAAMPWQGKSHHEFYDVFAIESARDISIRIDDHQVAGHLINAKNGNIFVHVDDLPLRLFGNKIPAMTTRLRMERWV